MFHPTRRAYSFGLTALAAQLGTAGCASLQPANAYVGTWSGTLDDGVDRTRVRLVILNDSDVRMYLIDQAPQEFRADHVDLRPDMAVIEFSTPQDRLTGRLIDSERLVLTSATWAVSVDFRRGDLFQPEPLSAQSVSVALQSSGAPALGAAFGNSSGYRRVIVQGVRSSENDVGVTQSDKWHLGSLTKSMTSTLVARLVEAGRISWDATVGEVLGPELESLSESYRPVTFRHLLSHHAGLQTRIDDAEFLTFARDGLEDARAERLRYASLALEQSPVGSPGERLLYTNNGYVIAGAMLEVVLHRPWEDLIQEQLFDTLGLESAGFGAPGTPDDLDQPLGHYRLEVSSQPIPVPVGPGRRSDNPVALGPAGRVHMNLDDLVSYLTLHSKRPESFLQRASWDTLHTPAFDDGYAMGWYVQHDGQLWHSGSNTLWFAQVAVDPNSQSVAASVSNSSPQLAGAAVGELVRGAMLSAQG